MADRAQQAAEEDVHAQQEEEEAAAAEEPFVLPSSASSGRLDARHFSPLPSDESCSAGR